MGRVGASEGVEAEVEVLSWLGLWRLIINGHERKEIQRDQISVDLPVLTPLRFNRANIIPLARVYHYA